MTWQPGQSGNPKGRKRGVYADLTEAIKTVEGKRKTTLMAHFVKRAFQDNTVLIALMKKMLPDRKSLEGEGMEAFKDLALALEHALTRKRELLGDTNGKGSGKPITVTPLPEPQVNDGDIKVSELLAAAQGKREVVATIPVEVVPDEVVGDQAIPGHLMPSEAEQAHTRQGQAETSSDQAVSLDTPEDRRSAAIRAARG